MCGRSLYGGGLRVASRRSHGGPFGLDAEKMSPVSRVAAAVAVLGLVAFSGVFLVVFAPGMLWIFTTYFWVAFPAFGLLGSGIAELGKSRPARVLAADQERELLASLRDHGEITAAGAASETSMTVAEADRQLRELAGSGHLEVRVRGGGLYYALWGVEDPAREIKPRQ